MKLERCSDLDELWIQELIFVAVFFVSSVFHFYSAEFTKQHIAYRLTLQVADFYCCFLFSQSSH